MKHLLLILSFLLTLTSACGDMLDDLEDQETTTATFEVRSVQGHSKSLSSCRGYDFRKRNIYDYLACYTDANAELRAANGRMQRAIRAGRNVRKAYGRNRISPYRAQTMAKSKKRAAEAGLNRVLR